MKKIILIDGNALIFRAFYATQMRMTRTEDNKPTNALYLFSTIILKLLNEHDFDDIIVALDSPGKKFRHQEFENYKANRKEVPEDLKIQFPMIKEFLNVANIKTIEVEGYEADDIIGTLSKRLNKDGYNYRVIFVGEGKDTLKYKEQARDISNIIFLGTKKNPYPYLLKSDCLILSSDFEGYPVVFLESLILGKPIITTDVSDSKIDIKDKYGIVTR